MAQVLIIDDDQMFADLLSAQVSAMGHQAATAYTLSQGMDKAQKGSFDVVYLDVNLPDGSGLSKVSDIRRAPGAPEVIIITGSGDPDGAEMAVEVGAWDYLEKPSSYKAMTLPLIRVLQYRLARRGRSEPRALLREGIVGSSEALLGALDQLARAAEIEAPVLITGETGTGKELFARALHANSQRAKGSLVVVDCTALPENLVASILFGHVKGAFTGAHQAKEGLIRQAHQGTLFLDEVGELPQELQKAFLRVLQERHFRPVGSQQEVFSDFRLVAATNRDLEQMVAEGRFRQDLLYRLRSLTIHLPPLRERVGDLTQLTLSHMARLAAAGGSASKGMSPEFLQALGEYEWPGNVRELYHTLEWVLATAGREPVLYPKHLPTEIRVRLARRSVANGSHAGETPAEPASDQAPPEPVPAPAQAQGDLPPWTDFKQQAMQEAGRRYLLRVMSQCAGDMDRAQQITGLSRARLYSLMKQFGLPRRPWTPRNSQEQALGAPETA